MNGNREKVAWALIVFIGIGLALPVLFGKHRIEKDVTPGDPWRDAIYDFQTLITGLAAVGAAYLTIRQSQSALALSREIEQKSELRHRQMMALTLRADRLKVSRSVEPFLPAIIQAIADLKSIISRTGLEDVGSQMQFAAEVENFANAIAQIIGNPQMKEAYELFEGKLAIDLDDAIRRARNLKAEAHTVFLEIRTRSGQALETVGNPQGSIKTMMIHAMLFEGCLKELRDGLDGLASLYLSEATALKMDI
ncbi:hypothetical protein V7795_16540 [Rhizobium laguerreae]|uniref:hypothetical protein n=1 Tax=Rhizobium laguerreae TaxID=1076926 RepID=UPI002FFF8477